MCERRYRIRVAFKRRRKQVVKTNKSDLVDKSESVIKTCGVNAAKEYEFFFFFVSKKTKHGEED